MPHVLVEIDGGGDLKLASEINGAIITVTPGTIPFIHEREVEFAVSAGGAAGSSVDIDITDPSAPSFVVGEFVQIKEGALEDFTSIEVIAPVGGGSKLTLKTLANTYTTAAKVYKLKVFFDRLLIIDPTPGATEVTTLSLYGSLRDQMAFRASWNAMTQDEFDFMVATGFGETLDPGTRAEQINQLVCEKLMVSQVHDLYCEEIGLKGPGFFTPDINLEDGGPFVSHSCATFEDQFEDFSGTATFDEYIFEIPFDTFLTRASIFTNVSSALDGYVTITKNDVTPIVAAGPAPPNRNLPAVTGQLKGLDLANVPVVKGDKITVRLNLVSANVIQRAKVVLAHAPRLKNL